MTCPLSNLPIMWSSSQKLSPMTSFSVVSNYAKMLHYQSNSITLFPMVKALAPLKLCLSLMESSKKKELMFLYHSSFFLLECSSDSDLNHSSFMGINQNTVASSFKCCPLKNHQAAAPNYYQEVSLFLSLSSPILRCWHHCN